MQISTQLKGRLSNTKEREMKMILVVSAESCILGEERKGKGRFKHTELREMLAWIPPEAPFRVGPC